jgi:hypothetical protein
MDMSKFVKALSNAELTDLQQCLILERVSRLNINNLPPLTADEITLLNNKGKVSAILAYRTRTNQTVLVSKLVVESVVT